MIKGERPIVGPWAAHHVRLDDLPVCWADVVRVMRGGGQTISDCGDVADGRAGLCRRHASEILLDVHPEGDGVGHLDSPWIGIIRELGFSVFGSPPSPVVAAPTR
jgi:hypothetical protein